MNENKIIYFFSLVIEFIHTHVMNQCHLVQRMRAMEKCNATNKFEATAHKSEWNIYVLIYYRNLDCLYDWQHSLNRRLFSEIFKLFFDTPVIIIIKSEASVEIMSTNRGWRASNAWSVKDEFNSIDIIPPVSFSCDWL